MNLGDVRPGDVLDDSARRALRALSELLDRGELRMRRKHIGDGVLLTSFEFVGYMNRRVAKIGTQTSSDHVQSALCDVLTMEIEAALPKLRDAIETIPHP